VFQGLAAGCKRGIQIVDLGGGMSIACVSRVLVVENDLRTRGQLLEILARPGFDIRAAEGQG
jgi:hypothetical protein